MSYSYHYLYRIVEKVREYLPEWLWRELHWAARAYAGGKSKRRIGKKYTTIDELPDNVKKLPKKKQRQWMHVFNNAWERYDPTKHDAPSREAFAFAQAWAAVQKEEFQEAIPIISKNSYRQIVYGIVYEPEKVDAQGDYMQAEAIEKACHDYMVRYRKGEAGIRLSHSVDVPAYVVENYIAPQDLVIGEAEVPQGAWVMAVWVPDQEVWKLVESGEVMGFSMGGAILESSQGGLDNTSQPV